MFRTLIVALCLTASAAVAAENAELREWCVGPPTPGVAEDMSKPTRNFCRKEIYRVQLRMNMFDAILRKNPKANVGNIGLSSTGCADYCHSRFPDLPALK
jgi:hypothetical protein